MGKPRLIILIRHAQSEGNKNRDIHQYIPDHRVKLTPEGWKQAYSAGLRLKALLRPNDRLHFFTSPYRRTRETTEGILTTLTEGDSPFKRPDIKVYEEPRLREQDFGNFQPCSAEMERMWQERADYGHFFYRIPDGESAADAYDRISGFNESLWRQFGEDDFGDVCVLVTHGLMSRVFLMKWYHFTVEYFEDLRNVNHCEFLIMQKDEKGKYILQNKLRTWSELRRERLREKEKENGNTTNSDLTSSTHVTKHAQKDATKLPRNKSTVAIRKWGGCPNGCDHKRQTTHPKNSELLLLREKDEQDAHKHSTELANSVRENGVLVRGDQSAPPKKVTNGENIVDVIACSTTPTPTTTEDTPKPPLLVRRSTRRMYNSDDDDPNDPQSLESPGDATTTRDISGPHIHGSVDVAHIDVQRSRDEVVSSPDATPSFISPEDRLRSMLSPELANMNDDISYEENVESSSEQIPPSGHHAPRPSHSQTVIHHHHHHHVHYPASHKRGERGYTGNDEDERRGAVVRKGKQGVSLNSLLARVGKKNVRAAATAPLAEGKVKGKGVVSNNEDADDEDEESDFVVTGGVRGDDSLSEEEDADVVDLEDIDKEEAEDRSIRGSVY